MFAWIDTTDCYGTIAELGFARGMKKRIVIAGPEWFDDLWFVYEMADAVMVPWDEPEAALHDAIGGA